MSLQSLLGSNRGDRLDRVEAALDRTAGALASVIETQRAASHLYVQRGKSIVPSAGGPTTLTLVGPAGSSNPPLAAQLVELTGLVCTFPPSYNGSLTEFIVTIGGFVLDLNGAIGLVLPTFSHFVNTQDTISATVNGVASNNANHLCLKVWGRQVPTTGMLT